VTLRILVKNPNHNNMKKNQTLLLALCMSAVLTACSKSSDTPTSPKKTSTAQLLINGGQWVTTGAVLYYPTGDSVVIPANSSYLGVGGAFLLSDVTFKNDTLASESDFGNLSWSLLGSDPTYLNANFSGQLLTAKILSLSAHTLVLYVSNGNESIPYETSANQSFNFTIFKQTLTN
jgi:hypothetical protein